MLDPSKNPEAIEAVNAVAPQMQQGPPPEE
jgi:hypothetical protein